MDMLFAGNPERAKNGPTASDDTWHGASRNGHRVAVTLQSLARALAHQAGIRSSLRRACDLICSDLPSRASARLNSQRTAP